MCFLNWSIAKMKIGYFEEKKIGSIHVWMGVIFCFVLGFLLRLTFCPLDHCSGFFSNIEIRRFKFIF